jgi:hypothetical protein
MMRVRDEEREIGVNVSSLEDTVPTSDEMR